LIDDFLYISTKKENVKKFMNVMHKGSSSYNYTVNEAKSMTNFDLYISDKKINKVDNTGGN
jgi:hypothetical protein